MVWLLAVIPFQMAKVAEKRKMIHHLTDVVDMLVLS
jgi:hypothetical protein